MAKQNQQPKKPKQPAPIIKAFGKEYCLQGSFDDLAEMNATKERWKKLGHKAMIKNKNVLYVTRFAQ